MIRAPIRTVVVTELDNETPFLCCLGSDQPNTVSIGVLNPHQVTDFHDSGTKHLGWQFPIRGGVLSPPVQLTFTLTAFGFEGHNCNFSTITPTPYNCGGALNGAIVTISPTFTDNLRIIDVNSTLTFRKENIKSERNNLGDNAKTMVTAHLFY